MLYVRSFLKSRLQDITPVDIRLNGHPEAVALRCSVKKLLLKICEINRKTRVSESLF